MYMYMYTWVTTFILFFSLYRGKAILILGVMKDDHSRDNNEMSESQLAVMVSRTAQEYSFVGQNESECQQNLATIAIKSLLELIGEHVRFKHYISYDSIII